MKGYGRRKRNKPETVKHKYTEKKEPEPEHHTILTLKHDHIPNQIMLANREGFAFDVDKLW
jgi:hypothetical protein